MTPAAVAPPEIAGEDTRSPAGNKTAAPTKLRFIFNVAIFIAAFLLFFVELLLGKLILPMFGGTPAVWTSCLLVFQVLLLMGYTLAHGMASRLAIGKQGRIVIGLLGFSVVLLSLLSQIWPTPITPGLAWKTGGIEDPALAIIRFLGAAIGFPFLLLSTTSPLLQHWWNKIFVGSSPYRLYALSNVGSLAALLSYPFFFEVQFDVGVQAVMWSITFGLFAALCAVCAITIWRLKPGAVAAPEPAISSGDGP